MSPRSLSDLGFKLDGDKLAALSTTAARPVIQRLGHLLDRLGHGDRAGPMLVALNKRGVIPWTELDRKEPFDPNFSSDPLEMDSRWHIIVRRVPEIDE